MSEEHSRPKQRDETRLCPVCRMPISVLATRCRHCGTTVQRPRKREANLTVSDLGGDPKSTYRPSGNVLEAIEAFRAEVMGGQEGPREQSPDPHAPGLPGLDASSRAMLEAALGEPPAPKPAPRSRQRDTLSRALVVAGIALAALVVAVVGAQVASSMMRQEAPPPPTFVNRAPELMRQGSPPLEVLAAARHAQREAPSAENDAVMREAHQYFADHVNALLDRVNDWSPRHLEEASRMTAQALEIDSAPILRELRQRATRDRRDYSFSLSVADAEANEVVVTHTDPTVPEQRATLEDIVAGRFQVTHVSRNQVILKDLRVEGPGGARTIIYHVNQKRMEGL